MTGPIVTLDFEEVALAAHVEVGRRRSALEKGRRAAHGAAPDWTIGIEGAAAEMAVAKFCGCYWSGTVGRLDPKDVGPLQVRSTRHEGGCLIVHWGDPDDDRFVLAVGVAPRFRLAGWITGREAKRPEWWRDPVGGRPAFFVPQAALHPVPDPEDLLRGAA